jgi:transposase
MARIKTLKLSEAERTELEQGYREGKSHAFRKRCQTMLLKSEERRSKEVAAILGCHEVSVNNWLKRFEAEGITGLKTKPGRGRKPILDGEADVEAVKKAVEANRQRLSVAKAELETELGKNFSTRTLERYIKNLVQAINASESVPAIRQTRRATDLNSKA